VLPPSPRTATKPSVEQLLGGKSWDAVVISHRNAWVWIVSWMLDYISLDLLDGREALLWNDWMLFYLLTPAS